MAAPGANDRSTSTGRISSRRIPCTPKPRRHRRPPSATPGPSKSPSAIRWDIDRDVIRGREFDLAPEVPARRPVAGRRARLPEPPTQQRFLSQVQGRTYANMFGLVERFIGAKMLEVSRDHWLGDQTALEALVRFTDEELKHQELFRRIERMVGAGMPRGLPLRRRRPTTSPRFVLGKCTWAVLALTCHIELFSQAHYRDSIDARRRPVAAVQGRVPVPLEGGVAARDHRRAGVGARGRASCAATPSATPRSTT